MLKDEVRTNVLIRNIFHEWLGLNRLLVSIQCCYLFKQFSVVTPSNCWRHHSSIIIWYSPCGKFWNNKKYPKIWNWRYMYRNHIKMYLNKLQMVIFVDLCHVISNDHGTKWFTLHLLVRYRSLDFIHLDFIYVDSPSPLKYHCIG